MTMTAGVARSWAHSLSETYHEHSVVRPGRRPYVFSGLLAAVAATAATFSFFFPSLLTGVKVANGNLRGTALVVLVVGLPVLVTAMVTTARGSARGLVVWLGTLAYLLYQAVLFCFATPLNNLFLIYVGYLGLAVWSMVILLRATDVQAFQSRLSARMPARSVAAFCVVLVVLNAGAWLGQIVPAVLSRHPATLVEGTGLLTNAVFVQDLAIWLPLLAVAAVAAWRRETWGLLVAGAMLAMFVLESVGIATDQWFGSHADPGATGASMAMVPAFAIFAVVCAIPLGLYLRKVRHPGS